MLKPVRLELHQAQPVVDIDEMQRRCGKRSTVREVSQIFPQEAADYPILARLDAQPHPPKLLHTSKVLPTFTSTDFCRVDVAHLSCPDIGSTRSCASNYR